ncbi:MAG: hypothetical protein ACOVNU_05165 [Candidatus Kapaibacteriota bacterium]
MFFTSYHYQGRYNKSCIIFIRDEDIINVYVIYYYDDEEHVLSLVMTEEKMMEYPKLYKKYVVSIMLTEDPTRLSETETGYYISKRTIYENLYITKDYNSKHTYMFEYPAMSYDLSADTEIRENMHIINNCIMIRDCLIAELIEEVSKKIENDLSDVENDVRMMKVASLYINKIVPENFPDDLKNAILSNIVSS